MAKISSAATPEAAPEAPALQSPALADLLGYNARRVSLAVISRFLQVLGPLGLRPVEFSVLSLIHHNPGATSSQLCLALGLLPPNLVGMVNKLHARGLLERKVHPHDRRAVGLHLSAAGRKLARDAEARARALEDEVAPMLTARERATLLRLLAKVHQNR
jgi:DNA-binding MarR family transcriptional regulator